MHLYFQVSSQAGTSIGAMAMTSPSGATSGTAILTHNPTLTRHHHDHHHIPLKTPIGQSNVLLTVYILNNKMLFACTVDDSFTS